MYDRITGWHWCQPDTLADRFGVATKREKIENRSEERSVTVLSNQAAIVKQILEKLRVVKLLNKGS